MDRQPGRLAPRPDCRRLAGAITSFAGRSVRRSSPAGWSIVTRPDAHQVVALDAATGKIRWTFTANGRVDTAPTIHRGLCLFGCKSGWVYCLRADDGPVVWRLRAAPVDERIVAYGQIESPWPVPGSVLVDGQRGLFRRGTALAGRRRHPRLRGRSGYRPVAMGASGWAACRKGVLRFQRPGVRQLRLAAPRGRRGGHVAMVVRPGDGQDDLPRQRGLCPLGTGDRA